MRFLIAGGSGFIGQHLTPYLLQKGHSVTILSRKAVSGIRGVNTVQWDGTNVGEWVQHLPSCDVLVNLCGENLANGRWTKKRKESILESRLKPADALAKAMTQLDQVSRPKLYIQSSGVGFYGPDDGRKEFTEEDGVGKGFISDLAQRWENASLGFEPLGIRRVILRLGVVLDRNGGALKQMALPYYFYVGGPMGNGEQFMPWIHYEDVLRVIDYTVNDPSLSGVFNVCAPTQYRNEEFSKELGKALHRPSWIRMPAFILRLLLGEMSSIVLTGQRVVPKRLLESGFQFKYPKLPEALGDIYK